MPANILIGTVFSALAIALGGVAIKMVRVAPGLSTAAGRSVGPFEVCEAHFVRNLRANEETWK